MFNLDKSKNWLADLGTPKDRIRIMGLITLVFLYPLLCLLYYKTGFSTPLFISFCFSLIVISFVFEKAKRVNKYLRGIWIDIAIALAIAIAHIPLYIILSYDIPFQISSDEFVVINACRKLIYSANPDLFGMTEQVFYFPSGSFIVNGYVAKYLGGIDLQNLRRVGGIFGLFIVLSSYFFFRTFYVRRSAICLTVLVGCSHVLYGLSRMAMRENHCLLVELIALTVLFCGLKQFSARKLYIGGVILGTVMYTYYGGRIVPLAWFTFLLIYCFRRYRGKNFLSSYFKLALPSLIGFILVAAPMLIAIYKAPLDVNKYAKEQLIIYAEGRENQRKWEHQDDVTTAVLQNIFDGLTAFNNNISDKSYIYFHSGNGFVDPLTGVFLWLGLFAIIKRRNIGSFHLLVLFEFTFIWLFTSFLITKNPSFGRILPILPFVLIMTFEGIKFFVMLLSKLLDKFFVGVKVISSHKYGLATIIVIIIALLNANLYADYVSQGLKNKEIAGSTIRYIESRKNIINSHYYFVSDEQYPYYYYGGNTWVDWIKLFTSANQTAETLAPTRLLDNSEPLTILKPAVIMLSSDLWEVSKQKIIQQYPAASAYYISGNRKQIAIEISN